MKMNLDDIDTPFLWVNLDIMESNIANLSSYFKSKGLEWRPHTKGIKIPEIANKLLEAGATGITCAKLSEAEVMVAGGINNILIANQIVGQRKIDRLCKLSKKAEILVALDNEEVARQMDHLAQKNKVSLKILVEVNVGMDRAGVDPGRSTLNFCKRIVDFKHIDFLGLMAWEGHAAGILDHQNKTETISNSMKKLSETVELIKKEGFNPKIISGAGSATYQISTQHNVYNEIQSGGAVFTDEAYTTWGAKTVSSLYLRSSVTSRPSKKRIITDAGWKTLPGWIVNPQPQLLQTIESVSMSSEHGVIQLKEEDSSLISGNILDYQVGYGDATVFLHEYLYGMRNGTLESVWSVQGRGKYT